MHDTISRGDFDRYMVPNYGPASFIPVRGQGSRIWDQQGREYVDLAGGIAVNGLGHCHPELVRALTEQAGKLWHISNVFTNEPVLRLAELLTRLTFAERVFVCNSGAEANEAAFKLARKYAFDHHGADKHEILSCTNSFHGRTLFTVSVGGQPKYTEGFGPLPGGIGHLPYNDIAALEAAISDRTCAVVIEPIQGEGGVTPATRAYLEAARRLCDKHGALLVFDEVQCGAGRTGSLFAYMEYGVVPDILTSAKALGGGFPIGAMMTTEKIAASFGIGTHGSTYGGNPLAAAVAHRAMELVSDPALLARVKALHVQLRASLQALGERYGVFTEIRGMGLLIGCELADAYKGRSKDILKCAEKHGLMLLVAGPNVLRLAPALNISDADLEDALVRLDATLADFVRG